MSTQQTNKEGANKKRRTQKGYRKARREESLRALLDEPIMCRYLWHLLEDLGPFGSANVWTPAGYDTHATAAANALKGMGSQVIDEIVSINPGSLLKYLEERKNLKKEEEGLQDDETDS